MKANNLPLFLLVISLISLNSCANYKLNYLGEEKNWEQHAILPNLPLSHTMYLVGDAGYVPAVGVNPVLTYLKTLLATETENSSLVFLGDNVYPEGLPSSKDPMRKQAEDRLIAQLDVAKTFPGKPFFVAGNHDWYNDGLEGVKRQEKFIEEYLDRKNVLLPKPGCSGPEEIELTDDLVLLLIDSQWYLTNWENETEINDDCPVKSRDFFKSYYKFALRSNRRKNVVVALHHPLYSNGSHGGQFTLKDHLFPLTVANKNLWVPLPIIGSIYPLLRGTVASKQDIPHPVNREYQDILIKTAQDFGSFIFASGHEHALQYFENDNQHYIVSGAGSKKSPVKLGNGALFAYGNYGYSKLYFYEDGSVWTEFWTPNKEGTNAKVVYRKKIQDKKAKVEEDLIFDDVIPQDLVLPISKDDYTKSKFGQLFWGEHYRAAYNAEVQVSTLDFEKDMGGLTPIKQGGGMQTSSLRLENKEGHQYSMRGIDKDATRLLSYPFNESFATDLIKDNFSASHPLAAMTVPKMADAIGIYHANPKLYFVPKQNGLGIYNEEFGDAMYLFEERPSGDWRNEPSFGNSKEIVSYGDMLEDVIGKHGASIDQPFTLRSRLFDLFIGDWDRHDDQWRWAQFKEGDNKVYRPIPRDRDQAYSHYDGFVLALARLTGPDLKKLPVFRDDLKNYKFYNYNSRHFDASFLNGLEWSDWEKEIKHITDHLTDEVIESAFSENWNKALYDLDAPTIIEKLKKRRAVFADAARKVYEFMAKKEDVLATEKRDLFLVERLDNKRLRVRVYDSNKDGEKEGVFYDRTFLDGETKEISLYGMDGDDFFEFRGEGNPNIKIRVIGGLGEDEFTDASKNSGRLIIYDAKDEKSTIKVNNGARLKITNNPVLNTYDRLSADYNLNFGGILPNFGFNPDDGIFLGLMGSYTQYGFKKRPFAAKHLYSGNLALETGGVDFNYNGEFTDVFGDWEFLINARYKTPLYAVNFYGLGNETENLGEEKGDEYYRVKQGLVQFNPSFMKRINSASFFHFGPTFELTEISLSGNRFIDEVAPSLNPDIFDEVTFVGFQGVLSFQNTNNAALPSRGINFNATLGWKFSLNDKGRDVPYIKSDVSIFQPLDIHRNFVLATRIGTHHNFSNEYEFFQGATLGGTGRNRNFRGFRRERFTGKTSFYQSTDLRLKLLSVKTKAFPLSAGILGGFDYGRVWLNGENSKLWHYSYGGGLWMSPFDLMTFSFNYFIGDNETGLFTFGGKFFF
ncbi:MAG: metallophosphoesterase [Saprospiraceae bacterium]